MDESLYWKSTPFEIRTLLAAIARRRREESEAAILRAGLTAAAVYNVNRKKGSKAIQPKDFLPKKPLTPEQQRQRMLAWAQSRQGDDK